MSKENTYKIETIQDLVQFDEEQLNRLWSDLKIWVGLRRQCEILKDIGVQMQPYMLWKDDGETGLKEVTITLQVEGKRNG